MSRGPSLDTVPTPTLRAIRRLRAQGRTTAEIGRQLNMQAERVRRICDHFGIERDTYRRGADGEVATLSAAKKVADVREYWLLVDRTVRSA